MRQRTSENAVDFVFSGLLLLSIDSILKNGLFQHGFVPHHQPQTPARPQVNKVHMRIDPVASEIPVSFVSFISTGSCPLPCPLLQGSLSPRGRIWWRYPIYG